MVYTLLVNDDRYSAPSLYLLTVDNDPQAIDMAKARLAESGHHHGVELWHGDRLVLKLGSDQPAAADEQLQRSVSSAQAE